MLDTVVHYGKKKVRTDPWVSRTVMDGNIKLNMAVHVDYLDISGTNETGGYVQPDKKRNF